MPCGLVYLQSSGCCEAERSSGCAPPSDRIGLERARQSGLLIYTFLRLTFLPGAPVKVRLAAFVFVAFSSCLLIAQAASPSVPLSQGMKQLTIEDIFKPGGI